jgi:short-subunit dehydrogenase
MTKLANKHVWITGASSGIGEQLAILLAQQCKLLVLSGRDVTALQRVQALCSGHADVVVIPFDLSQPEQAFQICSQVAERYKRIDLLINNAGISQRSLANETLLSVDTKIIQTNVLGTIAVTKAVLPVMLRHQYGQIVVVSSIVGKFGTPLRSAYAASKHALHGYFESLRAEVFSDNVKITLVCPGFVKTNISIRALTGDGTPQQRMDAATEGGLTPRYVAQRILAAIEREQPEVVIAGYRERLGLFLWRFFPNILRNKLLRSKVT